MTRLGMAAPANRWDDRLAEVGTVHARRIFGRLDSIEFPLRLAAGELAAGRRPILSFKVPGNDWRATAAGHHDTLLHTLAARLDSIPGRKFVTVHHEPAGDGAPADYAAMLVHALPILSTPTTDVGPIVNGYWWSREEHALTDDEIAAWLPDEVLAWSDTVAADTYHGGVPERPGEPPALKIDGFSAWADRRNVDRLGLGEWSAHDPASITGAGDAILADPRYVFACVYNSERHSREGTEWPLNGDRLAAFRDVVRRADAAAHDTIDQLRDDGADTSRELARVRGELSTVQGQLAATTSELDRALGLIAAVDAILHDDREGQT